LTAQERLEHFLIGIDNYINTKNLGPPEFRDEFRLPEQISLKDMNSLTRDECFNYAYMLYQYADHINSEKGKQEIVINWCKGSLMTIISQESENFSQYHIANKINEWKNVAEARSESLKNKEQIVRRKADCLMEKGKRI
jgi:hypothetical protein